MKISLHSPRIPRLTPGLTIIPLLTTQYLPPSLPRTRPYQTSLRLCLSGSGGEDSLQRPRPWRLLLLAMHISLTSQPPRPHHPHPLPPTNPHPNPCRKE